MKKSLSLIALITILVASGFSACQQKSIQSAANEENTQVREVLFLTLKAFKTEKGLSVELIDQEIREDYNNPMGLGDTKAGDTFKCEILDEKGIVVFTSLKIFAFTFKTDVGTPYTFLKFSESLPYGYNSCVISAKIAEGVWQELYSAKLK